MTRKRIPEWRPAGLSNPWAASCLVSLYTTRYPPHSEFFRTKRKTSLHHSISLCASSKLLTRPSPTSLHSMRWTALPLSLCCHEAASNFGFA